MSPTNRYWNIKFLLRPYETSEFQFYKLKFKIGKINFFGYGRIRALMIDKKSSNKYGVARVNQLFINDLRKDFFNF